MCLLTNNNAGKITKKAIKVYKILRIDLNIKTGSFELCTPFVNKCINRIPYKMEASNPLKKNCLLESSLISYSSDDIEYVELYECTSEGVHAYLHRLDNIKNNNWGGLEINASNRTHSIKGLICTLQAECTIPAGTHIFECYKPYYKKIKNPYDIAADELSIDKLDIPLKDNFSTVVWPYVEKYLIPKIEQINKMKDVFDNK